MANKRRAKNNTKNFKSALRQKRSYLIASAVLLLAGIASIVYAFTPSVNQPQCEGPVHPGCIIGANIGMGLFILLGLAIIVLALASILITLLFSLADVRAKDARKVKLVIKLIVIVLVIITGSYYLVQSSPITEPSSEGLTSN
jgi:uncharacterized BrkB/YihY/UPF0761 family membrane protein